MKRKEAVSESDGTIKSILKPLPRVEMEGNTSVIAEGVKSIFEYDNETITLDCESLKIKLNGENLLLKNLTDDRVIIGGSIIAVEFYN